MARINAARRAPSSYASSQLQCSRVHAWRLPNVERPMGSSAAAGSLPARRADRRVLDLERFRDVRDRRERRQTLPASMPANTRFHNVWSDTSVVTDDASSRRCNSWTGSLGARPNRQSVISRDSPLCSETKVTVQSLNMNTIPIRAFVIRDRVALRRNEVASVPGIAHQARHAVPHEHGDCSEDERHPDCVLHGVIDLPGSGLLLRRRGRRRRRSPAELRREGRAPPAPEGSATMRSWDR